MFKVLLHLFYARFNRIFKVLIWFYFVLQVLNNFEIMQGNARKMVENAGKWKTRPNRPDPIPWTHRFSSKLTGPEIFARRACHVIPSWRAQHVSCQPPPLLLLFPHSTNMTLKPAKTPKAPFRSPASSSFHLPLSTPSLSLSWTHNTGTVHHASASCQHTTFVVLHLHHPRYLSKSTVKNRSRALRYKFKQVAIEGGNCVILGLG